ncbi:MULTISPECIES: heavy-metal-associated domain-containing protein [unclassified Pseudactinotalea]|uniref:heavy-metal-associated domain-containing protein n=1 Tax=unclassified Pseudactinotalea TaxID=2649176 RepID=UPI001883353E|nr:MULTISPECIES: heavy metal-associated domain-containing protein [unclassified Pseudactinotalea]
MHTLTLTTQPMTCADCIATIEGVLGRAPGVRHVSVRFSTNQVHVDYNADSIAGSEIAWTLTRLGHPVLSAVEELAAA